MSEFSASFIIQCLCQFFLFSPSIFSQSVGINNTGASPDSSAILDVSSTTKGFLPPRMTTAERDAIISPADGLMIFNTTTGCLNYSNNGVWNTLCGSVAPVVPNSCNPANPTAIVEVISPSTGKTWTDRNLGANRAAASSTDAESYGFLYQWGRGSDGHQCVNRYPGDGVTTSQSTSILSGSDNPGHGDFIITSSSPNDWRTPENPSLWQGVNGINNPCPSGFRLPTQTELNAERLSWGSNDAAGAFASPLKLPMAGNREHNTGNLTGVGTAGRYSTSTVTGTSSIRFWFNSTDAGTNAEWRTRAFSVRCIKE